MQHDSQRLAEERFNGPKCKIFGDYYEESAHLARKDHLNFGSLAKGFGCTSNVEKLSRLT
jgi:hypothetical protein